MSGLDEEAAEALERLRDRDLAPAERARLAAIVARDPRLVAEHVANARLHARLVALAPSDPAALLARVEQALAASTSGRLRDLATRVERVASRRRRVRHARRAWPIAATIAAAAAVALALWLPSRGDPDAPRVELAAGAVAIGDGPRAHAAHDGERVAAGERVTTTGGAALRWLDGTRLACDAGTVIEVAASRGGKAVRLISGGVDATVAKQPAGTRFTLDAGALRVAVVGTAFRLARDGDAARLAVREGRVLAGPPGTEPVPVTAGGGATADAQGFRAYPVAVETLGDIVSAIAARPDETAWLLLPWELDLARAVARAGAERKPLLLWVAWADPLGPGDADTGVARAALADPAIAAAARDRCVPVAIASWWATKRQDDVGAFFRDAMGSARRKPETTYAGFFLVAPDGTSLASCQPDEPIRLRALLADATTATQAPRALGGAVDPLVPQPPADGLVALVESRSLTRTDAGWTPAGSPGRDHLWLTAADARALAVDGALDAALAQRLARYVAVDSTTGERAPWEAADVRLARIAVQRSADGATAALRGELELTASDHSYRAVVSGTATLAGGRATALALTIVGAWRDAGGERVLGIAVHPATLPLDALVPPRGARDRDYLAP